MCASKESNSNEVVISSEVVDEREDLEVSQLVHLLSIGRAEINSNNDQHSPDEDETVGAARDTQEESSEADTEVIPPLRGEPLTKEYSDTSFDESSWTSETTNPDLEQVSHFQRYGQSFINYQECQSFPNNTEAINQWYLMGPPPPPNPMISSQIMDNGPMSNYGPVPSMVPNGLIPLQPGVVPHPGYASNQFPLNQNFVDSNNNGFYVPAPAMQNVVPMQGPNPCFERPPPPPQIYYVIGAPMPQNQQMIPIPQQQQQNNYLRPICIQPNVQLPPSMLPVVDQRHFMNSFENLSMSNSSQESNWQQNTQVCIEPLSPDQFPSTTGPNFGERMENADAAWLLQHENQKNLAKLLSPAWPQPSAYHQQQPYNILINSPEMGYASSELTLPTVISSSTSLDGSQDSYSDSTFSSSPGSNTTNSSSNFFLPGNSDSYNANHSSSSSATNSWTTARSKPLKKNATQAEINSTHYGSCCRTIYLMDCGTTFFMGGTELPYVINCWDPTLALTMMKQPSKYEYYVPPKMEDNDFFGGQHQMWQVKMMQHFAKYRPDVWRMQGVPDFNRTAATSWLNFCLTIKLRFCCRFCKVPWTSKKGKLQFSFTMDPNQRRGWIFMKLFGQVCMRNGCRDKSFQNPACYPEEIDRAMNKISDYIGYAFYGVPLSPSIFADCEKSIRNGVVKNVKAHHRKDLCQACQQGICQVR